jgi:hypothetical protein
VSGGLYGGGDGSSKEKAVIINTTTSLVGIHAEYSWIENKFGTKHKDWKIMGRLHGTEDNGKSYETFHIELKDGSQVSIVFGISSFYCKF